MGLSRKDRFSHIEKQIPSVMFSLPPEGKRPARFVASSRGREVRGLCAGASEEKGAVIALPCRGLRFFLLSISPSSPLQPYISIHNLMPTLISPLVRSC